MLGLILAAAVAIPQVPDPAKTPGVVDPAATVQVICQPGYTGRPGVRHVTLATKRRVFAAYGIDPHGPGAPFEVDHRVALEDGGSNDVHNLWPESYISKPWNAHEKDKLENLIHERICGGQMSLMEGQALLLGDWTDAYMKLFGRAPDTSSTASPAR